MSKLWNLHQQLSELLNQEVAPLFTTPTKITLVIRTPELADGGVIISDDDYDAAIAEINKLREREEVRP